MIRPPFRHQIPGGRGSGCGWLIGAALGAAGAAAAMLPSPAGAVETSRHAYDARGRPIDAALCRSGPAPEILSADCD